MQKNNYLKINDPKERLRIVLASLQPGVNKSELCRKEGNLYTTTGSVGTRSLTRRQRRFSLISLIITTTIGFIRPSDT